jgi:hypothetical protein
MQIIYFPDKRTDTIASRQQAADIIGRLLRVRPAWALSIGFKSRMVKAVVAISLRQGCPSRGGI